MAFTPQQIAQLSELMKTHVDPIQKKQDSMVDSIGLKVDELNKKMDPVLEELKTFRQESLELQKKCLDLEGKQQSTELFKMWSVLESFERWYNQEKEKMFELRSTVCVFGPTNPPQGKQRWGTTELSRFLSERLPPVDFDALVFTYGTYNRASRAILKILAIHRNPIEARRIAASVMAHKTEAKTVFGTRFQFEQPKSIRLLQPKMYRIFDALVASGVTVKSELKCYRGMILIGEAKTSTERPLFPEFLIHQAVPDSEYESTLAAGIPAARALTSAPVGDQRKYGLLLGPILHLVARHVQLATARLCGIPVDSGTSLTDVDMEAGAAASELGKM